MSINIPNTFNAYGSVDGATGTKVSGAGFASAQTGPGVYTITLDQPVDSTECVCIATPRTASARFVTMVQTSDNVKTVYTVDDAGAATNASFDFVILNTPNN